jgi:hypothetical protein
MAEKILEYVAGNFADEDSFRLELHIADCDECMKKVHNYYLLREGFDELWDSWSAKQRAEEAWQAHILEGLAKSKVTPKIGARIERWVEAIPQKTEVALGIVVDSHKKAAQVIQEGLEVLSGPGVSPAFATITPPLRVGSKDGAIVIKKEAISVETQGPPWMRVTVEPTIKRITVQIEVMKKPWPLVVLIPNVKGRVLVEQFDHYPGTEYLLAQFMNVTDGEYFFLLESMADEE